MKEKTERTTISLRHRVHDVGKRLAQGRGFRNSFSAYVEKLIAEDAERAGVPIEGGAVDKPKLGRPKKR